MPSRNASFLLTFVLRLPYTVEGTLNSKISPALFKWTYAEESPGTYCWYRNPTRGGREGGETRSVCLTLHVLSPIR